MRNTLLAFVSFSFATICSFPVNADDGRPDYVENGTLVVARIGDSNQFAAYSKFTGDWTIHAFSSDVTVVPVLGNDLAIFKLEGDRITELVAVDSHGRWQRQKLRESTQKCIPLVASSIGVITIGDTSYGFSGPLGKWASTDATAKPMVSSDHAMIVGTDRITMFSAQSGRWSVSPKLSNSE